MPAQWLLMAPALLAGAACCQCDERRALRLHRLPAQPTAHVMQTWDKRTGRSSGRVLLAHTLVRCNERFALMACRNKTLAASVAQAATLSLFDPASISGCFVCTCLRRTGLLRPETGCV
jgi:hypothetical protein